MQANTMTNKGRGQNDEGTMMKDHSLPSFSNNLVQPNDGSAAQLQAAEALDPKIGIRPGNADTMSAGSLNKPGLKNAVQSQEANLVI